MNDPHQPSSTKHQPIPTKATPNRQSTNYHSATREMPLFNRQESDISLYDEKSTLSDAAFYDSENSIKKTPWTRKQWEALERWYVRQDRDCERATNAFFIHDSVTSESSPPLWTKDYILWRCRCLDTNTKFHGGLLPSERKRIKDNLKNMAKVHQLSRPKRGIHQQQRKPRRQERRQ